LAEEVKEEINQEDLKAKVWNVMEFAQSLYGNNQFGNFATPSMMNMNQLDININPLKPTLKGIEQALNDVKGNQEQLQGYTEWAEFNDMIFARILKYYSSILSFDLNITCSNISGGEHKSTEYKEDLSRIYKWLDTFNYKEQFGNVVKEVLRHETSFVSLRDESQIGYRLQKLPNKYCKITSEWQRGKSFDFNMDYFLQVGKSLDGFHDSFKEHYNEVFNLRKKEEYNPNPTITNYGGSYGTWVHTSPNDNDWCFKFNTNNDGNIPFLTPLLQDVVLNSITRGLQSDKNALSSFLAIIGEMPLLDNQTSGAKADAFAVDPTTMGMLFSLLRTSFPKGIKLNATPSKENESYQFQDYNTDMYGNQISTMAGLGASASRTLFATDKLSIAELQACQMNDYNLMKELYSQFNSFVEFYANKKTRKHKFKIEFIGSNFPFERKNRFDNAMTLADKGIVLKQEIASSGGYSPMSFDRMLEESRYSDFSDKLTQLISIHTASNSESSKPTKTIKTDKSTNSQDYDTSNGSGV